MKNITKTGQLSNDQRAVLLTIANHAFAANFDTLKNVRKMNEIFRYILDVADEALAHVDLIKKLSK